MKHLILLPILLALVVLSILIGALCFLYRFSKKDYINGVRLINDRIKFTKWYPSINL